MFVAFSLEGVGIFALSTFGHHPWALIILSGIVFLAWGEVYSLFSATAGDTFGTKHIGKIYGVLYRAKGIAALLVPLGNLVMEATGSWTTALYDHVGDGHLCGSGSHSDPQTDAEASSRPRRPRTYLSAPVITQLVYRYGRLLPCLSNKSKYGLKALLILAREAGRGPVLIADLAARDALPEEVSGGDPSRLEAPARGPEQEGEGRRLFSPPQAIRDHVRRSDSRARRTARCRAVCQPDWRT